MTFFARHCDVKADQRKSRQVVVEFDFLTPSSLGVTASATLAQLPFVEIALLVTGDAFDRKLLFEQIASVALVASDFLMAAPERKLCLVMVEVRLTPLRGCVAALALVAVAATMCIVCAMAGKARSRQILIAFTRMAYGAFDVFVRAVERKPRLCVIKWLLAAPGLIVMAPGALFPQCSFVLVVLLVTTDAGQGR